MERNIAISALQGEYFMTILVILPTWKTNCRADSSVSPSLDRGERNPGILKGFFRLKQIKCSHCFMSDKVDDLSQYSAKKQSCSSLL